MSETAADNELADDEKHEGDNQFDLPEIDITNDEIESVAISGDITMCDNDDVIVESTNAQLGESNDDNEDENEQDHEKTVGADWSLGPKHGTNREVRAPGAFKAKS